MPRAFVLVLIRKSEEHISMEGAVSSEEELGGKDWLVGEQLVQGGKGTFANYGV